MRFAFPLCVIIVATTTVIGAPASAAAPGTATAAGSGVSFTAVAGRANRITARVAGMDLILGDVFAITPGAGCFQVGGDPKRVRCPGGTTLTLDLGDGDDQFTSTLTAGAVVHGGPGNDRLTGGDGADTLHGDAGDDSLEGRGGDDLLFGGDGDDELHGGAGLDELDGGPGRNTLDGGDA
jgi:Ca2+-binding RTX toxin-like protein